MSAPRADVEVRLPADGAYASVLRTTTAGLAARLDFTIDDIEDLRMLVGEVIALLVPEAAGGSDLTAEFFLSPGHLAFRFSVPTARPVRLDEDSFAWQVLTTLADEVTPEHEPNRLSLRVETVSALASAGTDPTG